MREIKFRAWDGEKMNYEVDMLSKWGAIKKGYSSTPWIKEASAGFSMQYTGLKDKNGKEIYEGDIVSGIFRKGVIGLNDITLGKVMFYSPSFYICPPSENKFIMPFNDNVLVDKDTNYEIIGNIYENPELLK